jgi:chromosome partitioning protein
MSRKARVYAIMNRKGGVGKTTTAVTLGHGLARKLEDTGGHVLLVDLDPQGNIAASLGLRIGSRPTLAEVLIGDATPREASIQAGDGRGNLHVIPSDDRLQGVKWQLATAETSREAVAYAMSRVAQRMGGGMAPKQKREEMPLQTVLSDQLEQAMEVFDYIILDCPPSLDVLNDAVLHFADAAIVPVKVDYLGAAGTRQHTQNIIEAQASGIDIRVAWLVPTFFRSREVLANQILDTLREVYGPARVAPPIPQAVAVEQAPASGGKTIFEYEPDSPAAEAYWKLVELVHAEAI